MKLRLTAAVAAVAMVVALPGSAQDTAGAVQLGLGTPVFSYTSGSMEIETALGDEDVDITETRWGFRQNQVLLEIGYGLGDTLVVGAMAQLGGSSSESDYDNAAITDTEDSDFAFLLAPKLDVMLSPGQPVRPFIGAAVGLAIESADEDGVDASITGFELQARAGLRVFLSPGFSLDPALTLAYGRSSGEADLGPTNVDVSTEAFNLGVAVGFSGWIL